MKINIKSILLLLTLSLSNSILGQYYSGISTSSPTFVSDLQTLIRSNYVKKSYDSYDENMIPSFYAQDNGDGTNSVFCVYSSYEYIYSGTFTWTVFSREHTWCYSWMPTHGSTSTNEYSDYHHLFPAHQNKANAVRSNHPLGEVVNVSSTFIDGKYGTDIDGDNVYEPRDAQKGDAARALLYMSLKYDGLDGLDWDFNWLNGTKLPSLSEGDQSLETLLAWHAQDPPDAWEIARNDHIYNLQGNRNPFIDHPEYTDYINFNDMSKTEPLNLISELFFTEYVEGSSNNKALEIYNGTGNLIDLTADGYVVEIYYNGNTTLGTTVNLVGTIAVGDVFVLAHSSASATILSVADATSGSLSFNGNDAVVLKKGSTIIDVIGQVGLDPGSQWGTGLVSTADNTLRRKHGTTGGDTNPNDAFDPSVEWDGFAKDDFSDLGTAILPVELTSFSANRINNGVLLNWTTATEVNNYGFDVEAEVAGNWTNVGFVEGHGNSNSPKDYSFFTSSNARSFRLKQIDTDGGFEYSDVVTVSGVLAKTELLQNHPNPFNPSTQISFVLAKAGMVNVSVYNALGQKVAELVNGNMTAGTHNVQFNASNPDGSGRGLSSGFYFYRLEAANFTQTMKMLLVK